MSEFVHQCALFAWARLPGQSQRFPGIELLEGSMNGVKLTKGQAGKAKAAGMLRGAHDVRLPVARGSFIGLSIEMKYGKNKPTPEQIEYGNRLAVEGWRVEYCWDWTKAKEIIVEYLSMPRPAICEVIAWSVGSPADIEPGVSVRIEPIDAKE